jgi:hypothetical protein
LPLARGTIALLCIAVSFELCLFVFRGGHTKARKVRDAC